MRFAAATVFLSALTLVGAGGCGSGSLQHAGTGGVDGTGTGGAQAGSSGAGDTGGAQAGSSGVGGFAGTGGGAGGSEGWLGTGGGAGAGATGGGGGWAGTGSGGGAGHAVGPGDPCTAGDSICIGNSIYSCGSSSTFTLKEACNGFSPRCVTSGSQAMCQCEPGAMFCADGSHESRCNSNGSFDRYPCGRLELCGPLRCSTSCSVLSPDSCIDVTTIRTCVDGTITAVPCGPAFVCFNGECVPNNT